MWWKNLSLGLSACAIIGLLISINTTNDRLNKLEGNKISDGLDLDANDFEDFATAPGPAISFDLPEKLA